LMEKSALENVCALVLAAGKGKRMGEEKPKVMHILAAKPLLGHVFNTLHNAGVDQVYVVVGHRQEEVTSHFGDVSVTWVVQEEQLGTGHAVRCAREFLQDYPGDVLVVNGDAPFISPETIEAVVRRHREADAVATLLTCHLENPGGHGRILRDGHPDGRPARIVEEKDADATERSIREVNGGMYCFRADRIFPFLDRLGNDNAKHEYYLTEVVEILNREGVMVTAYNCPDPKELANINTPEELKRARELLDDLEDWRDG
jgi:UDP-N-acetylglucosamine diphosphorylase/glucosamine-1-phosphate N-acetyltransferase